MLSIYRQVRAGPLYATDLLLTFACSVAAANMPITRLNNTCPTGYYRAGDYCQPLATTRDNEAIVKQGKSCPTGFYSAGNYCKRLSGSDREAIPRKDGGRCPTGYYRAGDYCAKN